MSAKEAKQGRGMEWEVYNFRLGGHRWAHGYRDT